MSGRTPNIGARSGASDDAHGGPTVWAEHPAELVQALGGIGEEHEAELTEHGVKGAVREGQRLPIRYDGPESCPGQPALGGVKHGQRNVGTDDESRRPNLGQRERRRLARSGRDIKDTVRRGDLRRSQHRWHEEARPIPDVPVVRRAVDGSSHRRVEPWAEVHTYWCLTVFWCVHTPSALWPREMMCSFLSRISGSSRSKDTV
jgi:hypothetical protein